MTRPKRSAFDLSHDVKLSFNMGQLVPVCVMEAVPGDSFNISMESLLRFAPLVSPVMHRFDVTCHYFFVPNRLLWPNWETYITNGGDQPAAWTAGVLPAFPFIVWEPGTLTAAQKRLGNYLGLPVDNLLPGTDWPNVNAMPFAAYQLIVDQYYRDQNVRDSQDIELADGDNTTIAGNLIALRNRAWEHDYYTSALPFAQKAAGVTIPIAGFEDVAILHNATPPPTAASWNSDTPAGESYVVDQVPNGAFNPNYLYADTSSLDVQSATINDLRRAFRLQEWLEKNARGGTRYIENILSHFGVRSSDKRLQRPEYITGVKSPVVVSEVLQTGESGTTPQANMAGHAVGVTSGRYGKYFAEEHGYVIGIMSVMPKTAYMQGIPKHFLKINDPLDFYWPAFAHLGEQEVLGQEVFAFEPANYANAPFGYVPRYAEYKFMNNRVAGDFQTTLNTWHAARIFTNPPSLNSDFIESDPTHRIFAVTDPDVDKMYCHVLNKIRAIRPMPKFGNPSF